MKSCKIWTILVSADTVQESAKKMQSPTTEARDTAAEALRDQINRMRNFINSGFAKDPEFLLKFKPLPKGRKGSSGANGSADDGQTPPAPGA